MSDVDAILAARVSVQEYLCNGDDEMTPDWREESGKLKAVFKNFDSAEKLLGAPSSDEELIDYVLALYQRYMPF